MWMTLETVTRKKWEVGLLKLVGSYGSGYGSVGGQWVDRASRAVEAMSAAWLGSDSGWSKVHGTVSGAFECDIAAAAAPTIDAIAWTAGNAATSNATATRDTSFSFISFPWKAVSGLMIKIKSFVFCNQKCWTDAP